MTNEELVEAIQNGEHERIPELWEQVKGFVHYKARSKILHSGYIPGVDVCDLFQSGYFALLNSIKTYQPVDLSRFPERTFIGWLNLYLKASFAEAGGYKSKAQRKDPIHLAASLDARIYGEDNADKRSLAELLENPDDVIAAADEEIYNRQLRAALEWALNRIPSKEAEVIRGQYFYGRSLKELGPCAKERARLAMEHLRHPTISAKLRKFLWERTPYDKHTKSDTASTRKTAMTRETFEKILQGADDW